MEQNQRVRHEYTLIHLSNIEHRYQHMCLKNKSMFNQWFWGI